LFLKDEINKEMKKGILSALALMLFGLVNAQEVKFGMKGGMNLSSWVGDTRGVGLSPRFGVNIGALAQIKLSENFDIQPEIFYSTQGTRFKNVYANVNNLSYKGDIKWKLSYLSIPVLFKYSADGKSFVEAGPQIGFLTSAKASTKLTQYSPTIDQDVKNMFESVDFSLVIGVGYEITQHLIADLRYNIGLTNIAKTEAGDDTKIRNSVFSLGVGYKF
jgi:outer membrane protein with beta-barrel domain